VIPLNRERKYLLIGGMLVLLVGAVYRFYPSFSNLFTAPEDLTFKETELLKYKKVLQKKNALEAQFLSAQNGLARAEAALLSQGTPSLAAVEIQNMINELGEQKKIEIKSMRVLKPERPDQGEYMTVPVQVTMTASIRQLKDVLFRIENSQTLLRVSSMRIRQSNAKRPEELFCTLVVEGFMKYEEKKTDEAKK